MTAADPLALSYGTTAEQFAASLPPPVMWGEYIRISETIRCDLKLAVSAGIIPADARFWVRETSGPIITVELFAWPGKVLAADYATAVMDGFLVKCGLLERSDAAQWTSLIPKKESSQDARLASEVNEALALVKICADRRIAEAMAKQPSNYYGPIQYRVEISFSRLIIVAERWLRMEVDPEYAEFVHRARRAAERLGRRVVRQLCGEGGVDFSKEPELEELVRLDDEAYGRPVAYSRQLRRWIVVAEEGP